MSRKQQIQEQAPVGSGMFIPDYSGVGAHPKTLTILDARYVNVSGDTMTGNLNMNTFIIQNIGNAGTDFNTSGGLTLADSLTVNSNILSGKGGATIKKASTGTTAAQSLILYADPGVGTAGAGHGHRIVFYIENDGGTNEEAGRIECLWTDATQGDAIADLVFSAAKQTTMQEILRIEGNAGLIQFTAATNWTANGTAVVALTNLAPAGVGTSTVSKWLTIKDNAGTVYYIPAWT